MIEVVIEVVIEVEIEVEIEVVVEVVIGVVIELVIKVDIAACSSDPLCDQAPLESVHVYAQEHACSV